MYALIRFGLLFGFLVLAAYMIIAHGVRGLLVVAAVVLIWSATQTRAWQVSERWLVQLTGSRTRALVLVVGITIVAMVAVNLLQIVR